MKIRDLRPGMDGVTVRGRIAKISEKIEVETRFGKSLLAVALLEDETGSIRLNLWREQSDLVKVGDEIIIERGFVRAFKGQAELNVGSRGRITVISRG